MTVDYDIDTFLNPRCNSIIRAFRLWFLTEFSAGVTRSHLLLSEKKRTKRQKQNKKQTKKKCLFAFFFFLSFCSFFHCSMAHFLYISFLISVFFLYLQITTSQCLHLLLALCPHLRLINANTGSRASLYPISIKYLPKISMVRNQISFLPLFPILTKTTQHTFSPYLQRSDKIFQEPLFFKQNKPSPFSSTIIHQIFQ